MILNNFIIEYLSDIIVTCKNQSEMCGRSQTNLIDALSGILERTNIKKQQIKRHIDDSPFTTPTFQLESIEKLVSMQQERADAFIVKHAEKCKFEYKEQK